MGTRAFLLAVVVAVLVVPAGGAARDSAGRTGPAVAVGYSTERALAAALRAHPARVVRRIAALHVVELRPAGNAAVYAATLRRALGIRYVDAVSRRTPADEPALLPAPTGLPYEWQYAATRENAVPASVQRAAASITIAVVDTGADVTVPDLAAKPPTTWSVVAGSSDVRDENGHGTFVASLAAGSIDNGVGIAGFGGDAKLMVVQANRGGRTFTDLDEANAIVWAVDHGARIVNLSFGGSTTSQTERSAIDYAASRGVLLVAAAGNDYRRGNAVAYPAALLQPQGSNGNGGVGLAVGASNAAGGRAAFSNVGSYLSLVAPGVDVLGDVSSTSPSAEFPRLALPGAGGGLYGLGSGTSYAAPQVAGAAALVWAANPLLTAAQVAQILKETASNAGSWNPRTGYGVLDVAAAVARASGRTLPAASVQLAGRRVGRRVELSWHGIGASSFRLAVAADGGSPRVLMAGSTTSASYALTPGHVYVFTVAAVDGEGAPLASSSPYRVSLAQG